MDLLPNNWLFWLILGVVTLILEILTPGMFFFTCLGVASFVTILAAIIGLSAPVQWIVFVIFSIFFVIISRPLAKKFSPNVRSAGVDALIGRKGIVTEPIDPISGQGIVKVDGEVWSAIADEPIDKEVPIIVIAVEGTKLRVRKG